MAQARCELDKMCTGPRNHYKVRYFFLFTFEWLATNTSKILDLHRTSARSEPPPSLSFRLIYSAKHINVPQNKSYPCSSNIHLLTPNLLFSRLTYNIASALAASRQMGHISSGPLGFSICHMIPTNKHFGLAVACYLPAPVNLYFMISLDKMRYSCRSS